MEHNAEGKSERDDETDRMLCVDEGKILCPDAWGGVCDTDCGYCGGSAYIKAGELPDGLMHPRHMDPFKKYIGATHTASLIESKRRHPSNTEHRIG